MTLASLSLVAGAVNHAGSTSSPTVHMEPWQVINLVGSVLLALLFLGPVLEDFQHWAEARRQEQE